MVGSGSKIWATFVCGMVVLLLTTSWYIHTERSVHFDETYSNWKNHACTTSRSPNLHMKKNLLITVANENSAQGLNSYRRKIQSETLSPNKINFMFSERRNRVRSSEVEVWKLFSLQICLDLWSKQHYSFPGKTMYSRDYGDKKCCFDECDVVDLSSTAS